MKVIVDDGISIHQGIPKRFNLLDDFSQRDGSRHLAWSNSNASNVVPLYKTKMLSASNGITRAAPLQAAEGEANQSNENAEFDRAVECH